MAHCQNGYSRILEITASVPRPAVGRGLIVSDSDSDSACRRLPPVSPCGAAGGPGRPGHGPPGLGCAED